MSEIICQRLAVSRAGVPSFVGHHAVVVHVFLQQFIEGRVVDFIHRHLLRCGPRLPSGFSLGRRGPSHHSDHGKCEHHTTKPRFIFVVWIGHLNFLILYL